MRNEAKRELKQFMVLKSLLWKHQVDVIDYETYAFSATAANDNLWQAVPIAAHLLH